MFVHERNQNGFIEKSDFHFKFTATHEITGTDIENISLKMKSCSNESDLHVKNNEWTSEEWNICALLSKSELPSIFSK